MANKAAVGRLLVLHVAATVDFRQGQAIRVSECERPLGRHVPPLMAAIRSGRSSSDKDSRRLQVNVLPLPSYGRS